MNDVIENNDLVWDLNAFRQRQLAVAFVKQFENKLCVYSSSVRQIYTNYNIYFPESEGRNMVILPNPYAYHDTFHGVPEKAIQTTGLIIVPGELIGKTGLHLMIPMNANTGKKVRIVPLQMGISTINKHRPPDKPFLPILMKGDLREIEKKVPALHLHNVRLDMLTERSTLECSSIKQVISARLPSIQ